jgi:hypothetical protein
MLYNLNCVTPILDSVSGFAPIVSAARDLPDEPTFIPAFAGFTNHQVLVFLLSTPGALGATSLNPRYIFAAGDVAQDEFFYLSDALFYQDFELFGTFASVAGFADIACGLAGDDLTHVNNLAAFNNPVLLFATGQAFGPMINDLATLFTSSSRVDIITDDEFGEGDRFLSDDRKKHLDKPLIKWLKAVF